ncbi:MAG TPA: hypothetical protein PKM63_22015 [Panacibacter sp.]|nr:hypothetical protein [Panacibacter sp.]HNP46990.1 hypothetical protein [Panacibacter sp.]
MKFSLTILLLGIQFTTYCQDSYDSVWAFKQQKFSLHLDVGEETFDKLNAKLIIAKNDKVLVSDSLMCSMVWLYAKDMNSDGFEDIMIYEGSGARANGRFNLYLFQPGSIAYKKIEAFNNWPNIDTTEIPGVLCSMILTGNVEYHFFQLTKKGSFIDLKISEVDKELDGNAYEKGINLVRRKLRQKSGG